MGQAGPIFKSEGLVIGGKGFHGLIRAWEGVLTGSEGHSEHREGEYERI